MALYHTCQYCGSNLDPGERCDCQEQAHQAAGHMIREAVLEGMEQGRQEYRQLAQQAKR